jgi:hypothetical protein
MTREHLKDLIEATGFIAIIASLVFVGIETRNSTKQAILNTQALEIAAYQELMNNMADMNTLVVQDPEVAALMFKAYRTSEELTDLEQFRFNRACFLRFRHGDMAFFQYQRGAIDEARLRSTLEILNYSNSRVIDFWNQTQHNFVESYRTYINHLIDEKDN